MPEDITLWQRAAEDLTQGISEVSPILCLRAVTLANKAWDGAEWRCAMALPRSADEVNYYSQLWLLASKSILLQLWQENRQTFGSTGRG